MARWNVGDKIVGTDGRTWIITEVTENTYEYSDANSVMYYGELSHDLFEVSTDRLYTPLDEVLE